jgi:hypothetical protein
MRRIIINLPEESPSSESIDENVSESSEEESIEIDYDESEDEGYSGVVDEDDSEEDVSNPDEDEDEEDEEDEDEELCVYIVVTKEPVEAFYDEEEANKRAKKLKGKVIKVPLIAE